MRVSILSAAAIFLLSGAAHAQGAHPHVSPEGDRVVYFSFDMAEGSATISVYDFRTGTVEALETGTVWSVNPAWHPLENRLLFIGAPGGMRDVWDIYEANLDTGVVTQLTDTPDREAHTRYSPDGQKISFARMEQGADVFVLDRESGEMSAITDTNAGEFHPKWMGNDTLIYDQTEADTSRIIRHRVGHAPEILVEANADERVSVPAADGSGQRVAYAERTAQASHLVLLEGGEHSIVYTAPTGWQVGASAWRSERDEIVFTITSPERDATLILLDVATGESRPLIARD